LRTFSHSLRHSRRRAGFNACVDTIGMIRDQLNRYRDAKLLPR